MANHRSFAGSTAAKGVHSGALTKPAAAGGTQKQKARHCCRASARLAASNTYEGLSRLFLDDGLFFRLGLRTATWALGKRRLDLLDRFGLGDPLNGGNLTRQPVERRLVELTLGIGLFRLGVRPEEVSNDFGDGDDVAGINLGFVFLRAPRPHRALDPRAALERLKRPLDHRRLGK